MVDKFTLLALGGTLLTLAGTLVNNAVNDKKQEEAINKKVEELFNEYTSTPVQEEA